MRRVSADVDLDANGTVPLVEVRHGHLQRAIVQPDVKFGDSVTPELYRQWAAQVGLDQGVSSQGRLDELYMSFHERQHAELSALGRSRIEAAKAFMDGIVKREALRHAASSLGADTSLFTGQTGMQAGQGLEKEQKGSGVSRTPPVRMAQVFTYIQTALPPNSN